MSSTPSPTPRGRRPSGGPGVGGDSQSAASGSSPLSSHSELASHVGSSLSNSGGGGWTTHSSPEKRSSFSGSSNASSSLKSPRKISFDLSKVQEHSVPRKRPSPTLTVSRGGGGGGGGGGGMLEATPRFPVGRTTSVPVQQTSDASKAALRLTRTIIVGESSGNSQYPSNAHQTARYDSTIELLTFGFVWLIFRTTSSIYFFVVGLFQLLTPYSPTGRFATMGPYLGNKAFELVMLHLDNRKKKVQDMHLNARPVRVITREGWVRRAREDLRVGDIVLLDTELWRGEDVPVDLLLLYSPTRDVYVNQASLTGEQNPVQKKVPGGLSLGEPETGAFGVLYTTEPNSDLDSWNGELIIGTQRYLCDSDNVVLAGSLLMRGANIYGIVVATGRDTKINLKKEIRAAKEGLLDTRMNLVTRAMLTFLLSFILIGTVGYMNREAREDDGGEFELFPTLITYFLLFNGLIAQTLQFSLDAVRRVQGSLVSKQFGIDVNNYSALEQLALVDAIVFDKTGTLTANRLVPQVFHTAAASAEEGDGGGRAWDCARPIHWADVTEPLHRLLVAIALNNSAARQADSKDISYFGTSVDEVALLETSYEMTRYFIAERRAAPQGDEIVLHTKHEADGCWRLLHLFKYTSARGKMTVVVQNARTGRTMVITKGSPAKMYALLRGDLVDRSTALVLRYARQGLRVLLFAQREIHWTPSVARELADARARGDHAALDALCSRFEVDMECLGVTSTEDKLHPHLAQTMQSIQAARILTLVCTGDIKPTARNIGINAGILPRDERGIFDIVDGIRGIDTVLRAAADYHDGPKGVLIGKAEMKKILMIRDSADILLRLVRECTGVVVYSAGPSEKAQLTRFLMDRGLVTCCVGDGANDIEMIEESDVGIGVKAGENQHAASSADLAVQIVTQLPALLFGHGKQSWERNTALTVFISSMKLLVVVSLLLYDVLGNYEAKALYTGKMLLSFNLFFGWGAIAYGFFYTPVPTQQAEKDPTLYTRRPGTEAASLRTYAYSWTRAVLDCIVLLGYSLWWFRGDAHTNTMNYFGDSLSPLQFSNFVLTMVWVNLRVSLETGLLGSVWEESQKIHAVVGATIAVFLGVALFPRWFQLPHNFAVFVCVGVFLLWTYNYALNWFSMMMLEKNSPTRGKHTYVLSQLIPGDHRPRNEAPPLLPRASSSIPTSSSIPSDHSNDDGESSPRLIATTHSYDAHEDGQDAHDDGDGAHAAGEKGVDEADSRSGDGMRIKEE